MVARGRQGGHRPRRRGGLRPQRRAWPAEPELGGRIERGEDGWLEVIEGTSPHTELFHDHLDGMVEEHGEEIRQAVEEDEDFDPLAPDPEV